MQNRSVRSVIDAWRGEVGEVRRSRRKEGGRVKGKQDRLDSVECGICGTLKMSQPNHKLRTEEERRQKLHSMQFP
jgi:hypothetical protein